MGKKVVGRKWIELNGNYTRIPNIVADDTDLSPCARHAYTLMVRHAFWNKPRGNETDLILQTRIKIEQLAELLDVGYRSTRRYVKELESRGLVDRARRMGQSTLTTIFDPVTVYGTAKPSGQVWPDEGSPVAARGDSSGRRTSQDVLEQDIPEQQPRAAGGKEAGKETTTADTAPADVEEVPRVDETEDVCPEPETKTVASVRSGAKKYGRLRSLQDNALVKSDNSPKIGAPADAIGSDVKDRSSAAGVWNTFQMYVTENRSGYRAPPSTKRELGMCVKLLEEYAADDVEGLFEMVATRWGAIREKWPHIAKTPEPTFHAAYSLRRDLIPLVQTGKTLTTRTHRSSRPDNSPEHGWGDE